jgi:hypothetical protein
VAKINKFDFVSVAQKLFFFSFSLSLSIYTMSIPNDLEIASAFAMQGIPPQPTPKPAAAAPAVVEEKQISEERKTEVGFLQNVKTQSFSDKLIMLGLEHGRGYRSRRTRKRYS